MSGPIWRGTWEIGPNCYGGRRGRRRERERNAFSEREVRTPNHDSRRSQERSNSSVFLTVLPWARFFSQILFWKCQGIILSGGPCTTTQLNLQLFRSSVRLPNALRPLHSLSLLWRPLFCCDIFLISCGFHFVVIRGATFVQPVQIDGRWKWKGGGQTPKKGTPFYINLDRVIWI